MAKKESKESAQHAPQKETTGSRQGMVKKKFTKYERARIIGSRALQIAQGAPLLLKLNEKELEDLRYDPVAIAKKEFAAGIVPIDVQRKMPPRTEDLGELSPGLEVTARVTEEVADDEGDD